MRHTLIVAIVLMVVCYEPTHAADYFAEKTIILDVGSAAGNGPDVVARVFAVHLGAQLPGNPAVVVVNKPAARGDVAMNEFAHGRTDGTEIGFFSTPIAHKLFESFDLKVDPQTFHALAVIRTQSVVLIGTRQHDGPAVYGALTAINPRDLPVALGFDLLEMPLRIVSGYGISGNVNRALFAGEIDVATRQAAYGKDFIAQYVETGVLTPLWSMGMPGVPTIEDRYRQKFGKEPAGLLYDAYKIAEREGDNFVLAMPQRISAVPANILNDAMVRLVTDSGFVADMKKVNGGERFPLIEYGPAADRAMKSVSVAPDMITFLKSYLDRKNSDDFPALP